MSELASKERFPSNPVWLGLEGEVHIHLLLKFNSRPLLGIFAKKKRTQKPQEKEDSEATIKMDKTDLNWMEYVHYHFLQN